MNRKTYNPYNSIISLNITAFHGVSNDGNGSNLPNNLVDYAKNVCDRQRGAINNRDGYKKHTQYNHDILSLGKVFDGMYIQGDDEVYYQANLLLDYKVRPKWFDPYFDWYNWVSFKPYTGDGVLNESDFVSTFQGSYIGNESKIDDVDLTGTWRFYHIVNAINERRSFLGQAPSDLPTTLTDENITYEHINLARYYIANIAGKFCYKEADEIKGRKQYSNYNNMLLYNSIGGLDNTTGKQEWTNYNSIGKIIYRNDLLSTDRMTKKYKKKYFFELECALRALKYNIKEMEDWFGVNGTLLHKEGNTPDLAWANNWRWDGSYLEGLLTGFLKTGSMYYYELIGLRKNLFFKASSLNTSFKHKLKCYFRASLFHGVHLIGGSEKDPEPYGTTPTYYHDFSGGLLPESGKYYLVYESNFSNDANFYREIFTFDANNKSNFPGSYDVFWVQGIRYGTDKNGISPDGFFIIEWDFPLDDKLGKYLK